MEKVHNRLSMKCPHPNGPCNQMAMTCCLSCWSYVVCQFWRPCLWLPSGSASHQMATASHVMAAAHLKCAVPGSYDATVSSQGATQHLLGSPGMPYLRSHQASQLLIWLRINVLNSMGPSFLKIAVRAQTVVPEGSPLESCFGTRLFHFHHDCP